MYSRARWMTSRNFSGVETRVLPAPHSILSRHFYTTHTRRMQCDIDKLYNFRIRERSDWFRCISWNRRWRALCDSVKSVHGLHCPTSTSTHRPLICCVVVSPDEANTCSATEMAASASSVSLQSPKHAGRCWIPIYAWSIIKRYSRTRVHRYDSNNTSIHSIPSC